MGLKWWGFWLLGFFDSSSYSRWSWVKFLKSKDDSYDVFSKFCIQIQSEKELNILKVRSDHGGEFENEPFEIFCEKHGIIHEFSSPRTPQQNGVVERKNRSFTRNGKNHDSWKQSGKTFLGRSSKHSMLCSEQDLHQTLVEQNSIWTL